MARPQEFDRETALEQAMVVFWGQGYRATSLSDLLEATGLSKSSLYGAFGDKRALFLAAYDSYRTKNASEMRVLLSEGVPRQAIENFLYRIISKAEQHPYPYGCMITNQAIETAPHDSEIRRRVKADFQLMEGAIIRVIEQGQRDGSIASRVPVADLASQFAAAIPGIQVMVRAGLSHAHLEKTVCQILAQLDN